MNQPLRLLLVDDNPDDRLLVQRVLQHAFPDLDIVEVGDAQGLARSQKDWAYDLAIIDYGLPWTSGLEVLQEIKARHPDCPVIMFTGAGREEVAVEAVKHGLDDYIIKTAHHLTRLPTAVRQALERSRERQARHEAEARYDRLFDRVPLGLYRANPEGQIIFANPALVRLLGFPDQKSLLGVNVTQLYLDPEDRRRWRVLMETQGLVQDFEFALRCRDGAVVWARGTAQALRDESGCICWYEGSLEDITQSKLAEEALKASEKQYRLLFENNPQPMWIYDLETLAFLAVNEAAVRYYGYSREEFLAMTLKDIRPPDDVPRLLETVAQLTSGLSHSGVWRHLKKDGSSIDVEIISHGLIFDGRQARFVMVRDLTCPKQAGKGGKRPGIS